MSKKLFKAALIRTIKTMAETAIGVIGASTMISEVDWLMVGSAALLSGVVTMLTCVSGLPEVKDDTDNQ